ncbi:MAG: GNAT family N-acetyltransferase [Planctomycetota bacterium]
MSRFVIGEQGNFQLFCARGDRLGCILEQIAITRERAFRGVKQGTGNELDTDSCDPLYSHIWVWDTERRQIAGAYRAVNAGKLIREHGMECLYASKVIHFEQNFVEKFDHMVELGRTFITPEYQKEPLLLDMLWKGICHFLLLNPECHTFIGTVSISQDYTRRAMSFLLNAFMQHFSVPVEMTRLIHPRYPFEPEESRFLSHQASDCKTVAQINKALASLQPGKAIPVLIRRYLSLNAEFLSFVVTPPRDSLDGLCLLDVRKAPRSYRKRYLGPMGKQRFEQKWGC